MIAFGLLVIYEDESKDKNKDEIEYWINEGCDILWMEGIRNPEEAVTTVKFDGEIEIEK